VGKLIFPRFVPYGFVGFSTTSSAPSEPVAEVSLKEAATAAESKSPMSLSDFTVGFSTRFFKHVIGVP
jgi:hypothetical protein